MGQPSPAKFAPPASVIDGAFVSGMPGVVAMQACARIGATHSVVFGGFSAQSLCDRIEGAGPVMVLTADEQVRGGKHLPLKAIVDEALALADGNTGGNTVKNVIVYRRTGGPVAWDPTRDHWLHDEMQDQSEQCEPEWVSAEHPLFLLYTSGSTGNPKGVQHASGGYLLHAAFTTQWTFDLRPNDVFWCAADIGWVTGQTYITYGPLALGATEVMFEGIPTYPDAGRFWKLIRDHKVSVFYTAPTAIRSLIKAAEANPLVHPDLYDLTRLRILGSVGEPINPAAWEWYHQHIGGGRCPIVDTFWQTETGYFTITGRIDDVLNVSGHRMGTMEIESALVSCVEQVAEAAVVGRPDETTREAICALVVLKGTRPSGPEEQVIAKQLRDWVAEEIGPIAKPKDIRFGDNLPKTRSGKILRRLLRNIAFDTPVTQDISTLQNPAVLDQLGERH